MRRLFRPIFPQQVRGVVQLSPAQRRALGLPLPPGGLGSLGGASHRSNSDTFPGSLGSRGNPVSPYSEEEVWGGPQGATVTAPVDPSMPIPPAAGPQSSDGVSVPFGQSFAAWHNPTTLASVPILASTAVNPPPTPALPVLSLNLRRNLLIIQNNSVAPTAGDVAPTLYVGFNVQPSSGIYLALAPLVGITFDTICPRDSIFIAWGAFTNTGASVVIQGVVVQGTYIP